MEQNIHIEIAESCIRCGKCARVCPFEILVQEQPGAPIELKHPESCIRCGHCVAVCPTDSVIHNLFPADKVHPIDYTQMPTPEQVLLLCRARRSNRAITSRPVPPEMLDQILEAAHRAPTASNLQQVSFTVVTDPQKLRAVSEFTLKTFDKVYKKLTNPLLKPILKRIMPGVYRYVPIFKRLKQNDEAGKDPILRHATALIFIHTPASNRFGAADANLAYQNGSLMAESLGISQVYMGFVLSATQQDGKTLNRELGIEGKIHAIMALGMPAFRYSHYIDREELHVQRL